MGSRIQIGYIPGSGISGSGSRFGKDYLVQSIGLVYVTMGLRVDSCDSIGDMLGASRHG